MPNLKKIPEAAPALGFDVAQYFRYTEMVSCASNYTHRMPRSADKRKLSDVDVLMIREHCILNHPKRGSLAVSRLFGVSRTTVERIVKHETYQHLSHFVKLRRVRRHIAHEQYVREYDILGRKEWGPSDDPEGANLCSWFESYCSGSTEYFEYKHLLIAPDGSELPAGTTLEQYAAAYRKKHGIELKKVRKPRRTRRQMQWAEKFALKPGQVTEKEAERRRKIGLAARKNVFSDLLRRYGKHDDDTRYAIWNIAIKDGIARAEEIYGGPLPPNPNRPPPKLSADALADLYAKGVNQGQNWTDYPTE